MGSRDTTRHGSGSDSRQDDTQQNLERIPRSRIHDTLQSIGGAPRSERVKKLLTRFTTARDWISQKSASLPEGENILHSDIQALINPQILADPFRRAIQGNEKFFFRGKDREVRRQGENELRALVQRSEDLAINLLEVTSGEHDQTAHLHVSGHVDNARRDLAWLDNHIDQYDELVTLARDRSKKGFEVAYRQAHDRVREAIMPAIIAQTQQAELHPDVTKLEKSAQDLHQYRQELALYVRDQGDVRPQVSVAPAYDPPPPLEGETQVPGSSGVQPTS